MIRQALFLVGGKGSRLGRLTEERPKPLLEIQGRPVLDYLIENTIRFGIKEIILLGGYLGYKMQEYAERYRNSGIKIDCVIEPSPAGTAGALRYAEGKLDDQFLLCNGDTFFDINLLDLEADQKGSDWIGILALKEVPDAGRYGVVFEKDGRIDGFGERGDEGRPGLINGGLYLLKKEVLDFIEPKPSSLEKDIFPILAKNGHLFGKKYDRFFIDIGIPKDLEAAHRLLPGQLRRPAVFLDRDGSLNNDSGYVHRPDQFKWMEGAKETIKLLNDNGFLVLVITNQAGVARGYYDEEAVKRLHLWMNQELQLLGAHIDAFYYCPHHPEGVISQYKKNCSCRKPEPGMLKMAFKDWNIDPQRSFLIGDKESDLEAAKAVELKGHLFEGGSLFDSVAPRIYKARDLSDGKRV